MLAMRKRDTCTTLIEKCLLNPGWSWTPVRALSSQVGFGDTFFIAEVFVTITGQRHLCSAITGSRRRRRQQMFVMEAAQHRSGAHS
jgi:hypothetical protein